MFTSFEESVIHSADALGNLTYAAAARLLASHGFTFSDLEADNHGLSTEDLLEKWNAEALLSWLGY